MKIVKFLIALITLTVLLASCNANVKPNVKSTDTPAMESGAGTDIPQKNSNGEDVDGNGTGTGTNNNAANDGVSGLSKYDIVNAEDDTGYSVISTYSTKIYDKEENRVHNINLAALKVKELILVPNEEFSFNNVVGERNAETGFKEAKALEYKESVIAYGGGICQLSTTIYQAAKGAGLKITERHKHKKKVPYIKKGEDASVDYEKLDLKFINNSNSYLVLKVSCDGDYVHASIEKIS